MQRIANEPIWRRGNIQRGILDWGQLTPGMIDKPLHSLIPSLYTGRNCELKAEIHPEIRDNSINICRLISAPLAVNRCATLWIRHTCAFISRYRSLMKDVNRKLPSSLQRVHIFLFFSPIRYKWHDSKVCIVVIAKHGTFIHSFLFSLIIKRLSHWIWGVFSLYYPHIHPNLIHCPLHAFFFTYGCTQHAQLCR